jgi:hypothetical protein
MRGAAWQIEAVKERGVPRPHPPGDAGGAPHCGLRRESRPCNRRWRRNGDAIFRGCAQRALRRCRA